MTDAAAPYEEPAVTCDCGRTGYLEVASSKQAAAGRNPGPRRGGVSSMQSGGTGSGVESTGHARPGIITPYLIDDIVERVERAILDRAPTWEEQFKSGVGPVVSVSDAALIAAQEVAHHLSSSSAQSDGASE